MNTSLGEVGDQASLSSWHSDIGIPINFLDPPLDVQSLEKDEPEFKPLQGNLAFF